MSRYWNSTYTCDNCGTEFKATRSDAKFCSPKCRKQVSLERMRLRRIAETTLNNIKLLKAYAENDLFGEESRAALLEIRDSVKFTDSVRAAAEGSPRAAAATANVQRSQGTTTIDGGKSVTTGADTSNAVQPDVKSLKDEIDILYSRFASLHSSYLELSDLPERLHYFNDYTKRLAQRIDELEEATDWSKVRS